MTVRAQQLTSLPRIILENYPKLADNSQIIHNNGKKNHLLFWNGKKKVNMPSGDILRWKAKSCAISVKL